MADSFNNRVKESIEFYTNNPQYKQIMTEAEMLSRLLDCKCHITKQHCDRIAEYTEEFLRSPHSIDALGYQPAYKDVFEGALAARLHDVGKIGISDETLNYSGVYSEAQVREMATHSEKGPGYLDMIPSLNELPLLKVKIADVMTHHHTSSDKNYPGNHISDLDGAQLTKLSRIVQVLDVFDATKEARIYKDAINYELVLHKLKTDEIFRHQTDSRVLKACTEFLEEYIPQREIRILGVEASVHTRIDELERNTDGSLAESIEYDLLSDMTRQAIADVSISGISLINVAPEQEKYAELLKYNNAAESVIDSISLMDGAGEHNIYDAIAIMDPERSKTPFTIEITGYKLINRMSNEELGRYEFTPRDKEKIMQLANRPKTKEFASLDEMINQTKADKAEPNDKKDTISIQNNTER